MMVVNGAPLPEKIVWSQTVKVTPNTPYRFSTWVSSWYPASPANLEFLFDGASLGLYSAPATSGIWESFGIQWQSGNDQLVTISIIDRNTQLSGNDFALDDLSLTAMTQPLDVPRFSPLRPSVSQGPCSNSVTGSLEAMFAEIQREVRSVPDTDGALSRIADQSAVYVVPQPEIDLHYTGRRLGTEILSSLASFNLDTEINL